MKPRYLIDQLVRQTTVLIAQLSTASGIRAPLARIADQVFVESSRSSSSAVAVLSAIYRGRWHGGPSTGAVEAIEETALDHDVFDVVWPSGGGAVLLSSGTATFESGPPQTRPEPSSYYAIDANAKAETVGPLDGPQGIMHAPAVPVSTNAK